MHPDTVEKHLVLQDKVRHLLSRRIRWRHWTLYVLPDHVRYYHTYIGSSCRESFSDKCGLVDGWIETENALLRAFMPRSRGGDNSEVFYMDKFIAQHSNNVSKAHRISRNNIMYYGRNVGYQWSKLQKANETQAWPEEAEKFSMSRQLSLPEHSTVIRRRHNRNSELLFELGYRSLLYALVLEFVMAMI